MKSQLRRIISSLLLAVFVIVGLSMATFSWFVNPTNAFYTDLKGGLVQARFHGGNGLQSEPGGEYGSGLYTITIFNKTDKDLSLSVLLYDNADSTDAFNYAYKIIYTNITVIDYTVLNGQIAYLKQ